MNSSLEAEKTCSLSKANKVCSNGNSLSFLHYNVEGLGNKFDCFESFMTEIAPNVLVITEHQKTNEQIELFKFKHYNLVAYFCRTLHKGGGVSIYCKECKFLESAEQLNWTSELSKELDFELVVVKMVFRSEIFFVIGLYRSPSGNLDYFLESLDSVFSKLLYKNKDANVILLGDLNIDTLVHSMDSKRLIDCVQSFGAIDLLGNIATRITAHSMTSIDHVISNSINVNFVDVINGHISDHLGQLLVLACNKNISIPDKYVYKRVLSDSNISLLKQSLSKESWNLVYDAQGTNNKWDVFFSLLNWHLNYAIPVKKVCKNKKKSKHVVLNETVQKLRVKLDDLYHLQKTTNLQVHREQYKKVKYQFRNEVKNLKLEQMQNELVNTDCVSKTCWSLVNKIRTNTVKHREIGVKLSHNGVVETDPVSVCNIFNDYYVNVVKNDVDLNGLLVDPLYDVNSVSLESRLPIVGIEDVIYLIDNIKCKKSAGWDDFSPFLLKKCKNEIVLPLFHLVNSIFRECIFPESLKLAIVKPLYKKGEKDLPQNYRPLALTSTFSKIIEKIILVYVTEYYTQFNKLGDFQHGFRSGKSTMSAAAEFFHVVYDKLNEGEKIAGVFLDLSKAFDRVHHDILLKKLAFDGLSNEMLILISSFLENRKQCTEVVYEVNNVEQKYRSDIQVVKYGVPQGSILGPFLFICYVNDLPASLTGNNFITMYADDTSGLCWARSYEALATNVLKFLNESQIKFESDNLKVNLEKTNVICFRKHFVDNFIMNHDSTLNLNSACKFLGIYIDDKLTWKDQIDYLCSKISSSLYVLVRLAQYLNFESLRTIYFGLVYPFLSYGIVLWGGASSVHLNRIFVLQKKAIRIIAKVSPRTSCKTYFVDFNILTLYGMYIFQSIMLVKSDGKFTVKNRELHNYNTRNKCDFHMLHKKSILTGNSPYNRGSIFYNALPLELKKLEGKHFQISLKKWLIKKCPYTLDI